MSKGAMVVLTTCGTEDEAERLARALVERREAACVNAIARVASTYRWQGAVQRERETLLIVKTTAARLGAVQRTIRELSKYELPEVLALPVETGDGDYLAWLRESVAESKD